MKSATAVTGEIDDLNIAADELTGDIREKLSFGKSSLGIVFCDADVDVAELGRQLHTRLGFDIVGLTTTATIEKTSGYGDMGIVMTVITGDDVEFTVAESGELPETGYRELIGTKYSQSRSNLKADPKVIFIFAPYIVNITSENYLEALSEASGGLPVFGGVATDHYELKYQKTFHNGNEFLRGVVFALIGGNVKPVFSMEHNFSTTVERRGIITKSTDNMVECVDDVTFKEFLSDFGPVPDEESVIFHYQSTPFAIELPDYEKGEQPVVRALCTLDHGNRAGGFLSKMPENSAISINVLYRDNLSQSCAATLDRLTEKMRQNENYEYSLIMVSTCNARHLLMGDTKDIEAKILSEKLAGTGESLNAFGFYGFGEMCPTAVLPDGRAKNRFHNCSFAACAI